jgi:hypothetical protein
VADIDLKFVARQLDRVLLDIAGLRDEMAVQTAIIRRFDGTVDGLTEEVRAVHAQNARLDKREEQQTS